jgi:hypothetical protein
VTPVITQVVTAASYLPGFQARSWVSIFGWGLASVADPGVNALAVGIANGLLTDRGRRRQRDHQRQERLRGLHQPQINVQARTTAQGLVSVVDGAVSGAPTPQRDIAGFFGKRGHQKYGGI